jgi:DNA-binding LytR/AlgR family response regulator
MSTRWAFFKDHDQLKKLAIDEIFLLEVTDNYVKIFIAPGGIVMVRSTLEALLRLLPDKQFVRLSRTYAAGVEYIEYITKDSLRILGLDHEIPVTKHYYEKLREKLLILGDFPAGEKE